MRVLMHLNKTEEDCLSNVDEYVSLSLHLPVIPRIGETVVIPDYLLDKHGLDVENVKVVDVQHYALEEGEDDSGYFAVLKCLDII